MAKSKIPLKKALIWILWSTVFITGSVTGAYYYYAHLKILQQNDARYTIVAIVQSGPDKGVLKTEYLAELLGLSVDKPHNLYSFNLTEAKQKLLASPLIKKVNLKRVKPGTLYVNYSVRKPIAFVGDYTNTAIDLEGVFIPFKPFFSPKNIPQLILGNNQVCTWGTHLKGEIAGLALSLLNEILSLSTTSQVQKIDFSEANLPSYGQRQIVIHLQNPIPQQTRFLRLSLEDISQQLANYLVLEEELNASSPGSISLVIDLRIPKLAFIDTFADYQ